MLIDRDVIFEFLRDALGRIFVIAGLFTLAIGLLYVTPVGSWTSALGLFFGVFLVDIGFMIHFELFKVKLRSKEGLGNILVCIAPLLIVSGVISVLFAEPDWSHAYVLPPTKMGYPKGWHGGWVTVLAPLVRIYAWLAIPLAFVGVVLLVVGLSLKVYDAVF